MIPSRPAADIDSILIPDKLILTRNRFHDFLESIPGLLGIDSRNVGIDSNNVGIDSNNPGIDSAVQN